MATEYRKFKLSPGQTSPEGTARYSIGDSWIVWVGEEGTLPAQYISQPMSQDEITRFLARNRLRLSKLEFQKRFTFAELVAIETAAETDPAIRVLQKQQQMAEYIDVTDPTTRDGVLFLVSKGLLTQERADTILTL